MFSRLLVCRFCATRHVPAPRKQAPQTVISVDRSQPLATSSNTTFTTSPSISASSTTAWSIGRSFVQDGTHEVAVYDGASNRSITASQHCETTPVHQHQRSSARGSGARAPGAASPDRSGGGDAREAQQHRQSAVQGSTSPLSDAAPSTKRQLPISSRRSVATSNRQDERSPARGSNPSFSPAARQFGRTQAHDNTIVPSGAAVAGSSSGDGGFRQAARRNGTAPAAHGDGGGGGKMPSGVATADGSRGLSRAASSSIAQRQPYRRLSESGSSTLSPGAARQNGRTAAARGDGGGDAATPGIMTDDTRRELLLRGASSSTMSGQRHSRSSESGGSGMPPPAAAARDDGRTSNRTAVTRVQRTGRKRDVDVYVAQPRLLTALIQAAMSVQTLDEVVSQHRGAMNHIHVTAAIVKVAKFQPSQVMPDLPTAAATPVTPIGPLMLDLINMLLQPYLNDGSRAEPPLPRFRLLDARSTSNAIWAVAKAGYGRTPAFRQLLARLRVDEDGILSRCNAQDVSNVTYACALAGFLSEPGLARALRDRVTSMDLDTFSMQDCSNILWAHATAGTLELSLAAVLNCRVERIDLRTAKPQELSNSLWANATAGTLEPALSDLLCNWALHEMDLCLFKPQDFSNILWACATAGTLDRDFAQQLCRHVESRDLTHFSPQSISLILWACATIGVFDQKHGQKLLRHVTTTVDVSTFNMQDCANVVWACATAEYYSPRLMEAVAKWVLASGGTGGTGGGTAAPQAWSNLLWGFAALRHSAPALFEESLPLLSPVLHTANGQSLANLMWAYASVAPPAVLTAFLDAVAGFVLVRLPSFNGQELCNAAWALAVAGRHLSHGGASGRGLAEAVVAEAVARSDAGAVAFATAGYCQLHQLFWQLQHSAVGAGRLDSTAAGGGGSAGAATLPAAWRRLQQQAEAVWRRHVDNAEPSDDAQQIFNTLRCMGLKVALEQPSPCGNFSVDLLVTVPKTDRRDRSASSAAGGGSDDVGGSDSRGGDWRVIPVEVDGPYHFMRNDLEMYDGPTSLRNDLLAISYGAPVVMINLAKERLDWSFAKSPTNQQRLRELLGLDA